MDKENLFNNQEPLKLVIISFILMTLTSDLVVIMQREIKCLSPLGLRGLKPEDSLTYNLLTLDSPQFPID